MENVKLSSIVASQLPDFIRSDYPKFVTFLEKYYEWMEQIDRISYETDALKNSYDIDESDSYYLDLLKKDLLPYFPTDLQADKRLFLKLATNLYKAKGTENSIKFLFRALYNDNIEIYLPKEDILKASDGKWTLPLALRIDTDDNNIFNIAKTLITGQNSKATAVVEKVVRSVDRQLGVSYIEAYVSNVDRLFETGETLTSTYIDPLTDLEVTVNGRLIGSLSEIKIIPTARGLFYNGFDPDTNYIGDPVSIVGGLNPDSNFPLGAIAYVGETTKGGITDILVVKSGFGFRDPAINLNSSIIDFKGGFENVPLGTEAKASISLLDTSISRKINISNMSVSTLDGLFPTISVIEARTISGISTYQAFNVFPISFVTVEGSGGGYRTKPDVETYSLYNEDLPDSLIASSLSITKGTNRVSSASVNFATSLEPGNYVRLFVNNKYEEVKEIISVDTNTVYFADNFQNDITNVSLYKINRNDLYKLGSIGRINVVDGGGGYVNGDILIFSGGSGYGANGYVNVATGGSGTITSVTINNHSSGAYIIGGEGYGASSLPVITVQSAAGVGANLAVSEIVGDGEQYGLTTSRIGAITSLRILSYGYDYISAPTVSLRNADLITTAITEGQLFVSNTAVYQGTSNTNFTFKALVDNYYSDTGLLRVYDYIGTLDVTELLKSDNLTHTSAVTATVASSIFYGDGNAKANAKFENGLIRYPGIYLNTDGHISSDKKLQDGEKYHNFSYIIKTETDYAKFKGALNDIVHPIGTKTFVIRVDKNEEVVSITNNAQFITVTDLSDKFNIAVSSNTIVSTNVDANLLATINVGDVIILSNVHKTLQNTVNVVTGSNLVFGHANSVNFINDLQEGDTIYLSTGDTRTVKTVTNSNYAILNTAVTVTSTSAKINVIYTEVSTANSVNANTIITKTTFKANGSNLNATIQKVR
jgi:hypothetical protein